MKRTSIISIDQFKGSNLHKVQTRVEYNIWEDEKIIAYRCCDLRGKVSYEKAKFILDTFFMTKEEYLEEHKVELNPFLAEENIY